MTYDNIRQSDKSALIQLFYLEELSKQRALLSTQKVDMVSIASSVSPLKTDVLPKEIKHAIKLRLENDLVLLKGSLRSKNKR